MKMCFGIGWSGVKTDNEAEDTKNQKVREHEHQMRNITYPRANEHTHTRIHACTSTELLAHTQT